MSNRLVLEEYKPGQDEASMRLPEGYRCADCKFFSYCKALFQCDETNTWCDWAPSRFIQGKQQ